LSIQDYNGISLRASEQFCKIAAHIQHRMAVVPLFETHITAQKYFDQPARYFGVGCVRFA